VTEAEEAAAAGSVGQSREEVQRIQVLNIAETV